MPLSRVKTCLVTLRLDLLHFCFSFFLHFRDTVATQKISEEEENDKPAAEEENEEAQRAEKEEELRKEQRDLLQDKVHMLDTSR